MYYKGVDVLLKAMAEVNARLVIIGRGSLENELKALSEKLGISHKVSFLGRVGEEELMDNYSACAFLVLPPIGMTECFGLVQVEAMMCAKAVINTSLNTGVPWVRINEVTGLTVPPGDVSALRNAICRLLQDESLRIALGQQGELRAREKFRLPTHCEAVEQLYMRLVRESEGDN